MGVEILLWQHDETGRLCWKSSPPGTRWFYVPLTETAIDLLRDIALFSYRIDGRLTPEYESGWNDAVLHISAKAAEFLKQIGRDDPDEETEGNALATAGVIG